MLVWVDSFVPQVGIGVIYWDYRRGAEKDALKSERDKAYKIDIEDRFSQIEKVVHPSKTAPIFEYSLEVDAWARFISVATSCRPVEHCSWGIAKVKDCISFCLDISLTCLSCSFWRLTFRLALGFKYGCCVLCFNNLAGDRLGRWSTAAVQNRQGTDKKRRLQSERERLDRHDAILQAIQERQNSTDLLLKSIQESRKRWLFFWLFCRCCQVLQFLTTACLDECVHRPCCCGSGLCCPVLPYAYHCDSVIRHPWGCMIT